MATEEEVQAACDDLIDAIGEIADDTSRWTQAESAEIYESLAYDCNRRAKTIKEEMGGR